MKGTDASQFEGILDRYFEEMLADRPLEAVAAGLREGEGRLERPNRAFEARQEKRRRRALESLDSVSPRALSNEQQLDRLAFRSLLLRETEEFERGRHTLDPNALDTLLNIFLRELQRGEDEPERGGKNLRALLKGAPAYLAEAEGLVQHPEPVWREVMRQTAEGAKSLFEAVGQFLSRHGSTPQDAALIENVRAGFRQYADRILDRPPAPEGSFAAGAHALQRRVRDDLGLDYTLGEIEALASAEAVRLGRLIERACRKFGGQGAGQILEEARAAWAPDGDLVELYRKDTTRVANAFREAGAMTFPERDQLDVRPVPEFMRHLFPTAAYSAPGAFEKRQRGIFWVNDLSLWKTTEAGKRAERAQHFGLSLTCAHEAYPGHHLQFVIANRHRRKWRRLFAHAVFYEGWTLWCEQMMVDLRVDRSPWLQVQQLHDALWRCHRILVDVRLQTGRYSYRQAVRHLEKQLGFTKARAEADVNWYTAAPGVPMSYWLGRLENERLHRKLVRGRGWELKRFNDWLLSFGTLPQSWIERYGLD